MCIRDRFWYHTDDGRVLGPTSPGFGPPEVTETSEIRPTTPTQPRDRRIWSWFERTDLHTGEVAYEYIEPLVAHLRHPLERESCLFVHLCETPTIRYQT